MGASAYPSTLYILGTSQNSGKTVASIGMICKLLSPQYGLCLGDIGFMKPVGQQVVPVPNGDHMKAERDAVLVTSLMGIASPQYDLVSPLVWTDGRTVSCIDQECSCDPRQVRDGYLGRILEAFRHLSVGKRVMIVEGTGQMGVGSVAGVSSVDVILGLRSMGVPVYVIMVTPGDAQLAIAESVPHLLALAHTGVYIDGLLVNRVPTSELEATARVLTAYYQRLFPRLYGPRCRERTCVDILGCVPEMEDLALPTVRLVREFLTTLRCDLEVVSWPGRRTTEYVLVRRKVIVSLERDYHQLLRDGDLVVVGINANARIVSLLEHHRAALEEGGQGLAGILLSCKSVGGLLPSVEGMLRESGLSVMALDLDSAEVVQRLATMTVKLQPYDAAKRDLIDQVYGRHLEHLPGLVAVVAPHGNGGEAARRRAGGARPGPMD